MSSTLPVPLIQRRVNRRVTTIILGSAILAGLLAVYIAGMLINAEYPLVIHRSSDISPGSAPWCAATWAPRSYSECLLLT